MRNDISCHRSLQMTGICGCTSSVEIISGAKNQLVKIADCRQPLRLKQIEIIVNFTFGVIY